jgi:hypothetical protein
LKERERSGQEGTSALNGKVVGALVTEGSTKLVVEFTDGTKLNVGVAGGALAVSVESGSAEISPIGRAVPAGVPRFTALQGQYLAFIHAYSVAQRRPPAEHELQAFFGVTPPTVHQMVLTLASKGLISREPGQARSLRLLVPPDQLPVLRTPGDV